MLTSIPRIAWTNVRLVTAVVWLAWISLTACPAVQADEPGLPYDARADNHGREARPNILWISSEDNGPQLSCYGDAFADTPNLDALAAGGMIYRHCWSTAPVCAPARTAIISGLYPTSTGSQHMRSMTRLPDGISMFPALLREAGYYCTNNRKEDYNLVKEGPVWHESSGEAHYRNREEGQPFFAVFNFTVSHESQVRRRPHEAVHDAAQVTVPAYHPDRPEVRRDWAQYYDKVTEMDDQAGRVLEELEAAGLRDDTIVVYFGDHGPGLPRGKRWPYNSGLHVPLIVQIPERWAHLRPPGYEAGGSSERLVAFVDLAPTTLSLAGVQPPAWMQGRAFAGAYTAPPRPYNFGFRGRMDERYDMVRTVTDGRYVYIRHFMPHKIYGQYIQYMFQTPTTQVWKDLYDAGELEPPQTLFWEVKPPEELYDLQQDPDEVVNLADSPEHAEVKQLLRGALREWMIEVRDLGFLPEAELHRRSGSDPPYVMGHDPGRYAMHRILKAAETAARRDPEALPELGRLLQSDDSAIRYWAAMGGTIRGPEAVQVLAPLLRERLADENPSVSIAAAEALGRYGNENDVQLALDVLVEYAALDRHGVYLAMPALNAIDAMDERAAGAVERIRELPREHAETPRRMRSYVPNLLDKTLADL